jgi:hypothetical protein
MTNNKVKTIIGMPAEKCYDVHLFSCMIVVIIRLIHICICV